MNFVGCVVLALACIIAGTGAANLYAGVLRTGSGGNALWVGASWGNFVAKDNEFRGQGLRIIDINVEEIGFGQVRYDGVWRAGSDASSVLHNQSFENLANLWRTLNDFGLRLIDVEAYREDGMLKFAGVWRSGSGPSALYGGLTQDDFIDMWRTLARQNLRLLSVDTYIDPALGPEVRYVGVWGPGSDGYALWIDTSLAHFRDKIHEFEQQNLFLIDVDITPTGSWVGVFREAPSSTRQALIVTDSFAEFDTIWRSVLNIGYVLIDYETA